MGLTDTFNSYQSSQLSDLYPSSTLGGSQVDLSGVSATGSSGGGMSGGAVVGLIGQVLGVGSQIYEGILQNSLYKANANLAQAQGNYESSVAQFNAAVARANAEAIRASADLDIERQKKSATRFKSGQIAGYAKAGVKLEGSPLSVMIDSAMEAKLDMAITDYNAKIGIMQAQSQAKGFDRSAEIAKTNAETSSKLLKTVGKFQQNQGIIGATSSMGQSLLSTVSSYSR